MTTLITVRDPGGAGRCDAKCYDAAPGTDCACVCRSVNHSAGLEKAIAATRALAGRWAGRRAEFPPAVMHEPLFLFPAPAKRRRERSPRSDRPAAGPAQVPVTVAETRRDPGDVAPPVPPQP